MKPVDEEEVPFVDPGDKSTQSTQGVDDGTTSIIDHIDWESPTIQPVDSNDAEMEDTNRPVIVREEGMVHNNPRIQNYLDIWQKIKEYDQRSAENPFVPVLSKKQQQMLKKHRFNGKAPYKTRSTGPSSPPPQ